MSETTSNRPGRHLDKRVPIGIILTVFVQTVGMVWFLALQSAQVQQNTRDIAELNGHSARIVRIETKLELQTKTLERVEEKFDRLDRRLDNQE